MKKQFLCLLAGVALLPACRCYHCNKIAQLERKLEHCSCPCTETTTVTTTQPAPAALEVETQKPVAEKPEPIPESASTESIPTESVTVAVAVAVNTQQPNEAPTTSQEITVIDAKDTEPDNLTDFK